MKMRNKVFYGRFTKPEIERLRIRYDHLFCEIIRTYNTILRDTEIEELKRRIDELERRVSYEEH
jgi:polyhydroxyalkanoate synthesis regulator phasin